MRRTIDASQTKYAGAAIIEQVKSDHSELTPTLQQWTDILHHMQPVPVDTYALAVGLRDEAQKIAADIDLLSGDVAVAIAEAHRERVRGLERAYSHVQPEVDGEISKNVEWEDMPAR